MLQNLQNFDDSQESKNQFYFLSFLMEASLLYQDFQIYRIPYFATKEKYRK